VIGVTGSGTTRGYSGEFVLANGVSNYRSDVLGTGFSVRYESPALGTPSVSDDASTKSTEQIRFEERRSRLISIVDGMKRSAPNWSGLATVVREDSANNAVQFLRCLPGDAILPRVAPDGEGDVMFVWDGSQTDNCVVTVEKQLLHLVSKPGTPDVQQVGPQQFLGFSIPSSIQSLIPRK
jgi:hypothetical protein